MADITGRSALHTLDTVSECVIFVLTFRMQFSCLKLNPEHQEVNPDVLILFYYACY